MKKTLIASLVFFCLVSLAFAGTLIFKNMVTRPVLEEAILQLAIDLKRGQNSYTRDSGLTWTAGTYARRAVFIGQMGRDYNFLYASLAANFNNPKDYWVKQGAKESVRSLYEHIMQSARQTLQEPAALQAMYFFHKADTLTLVRKYGISAELKKELKEMLPYFDGTLDTKTAKLCESRRLAYKKWVRNQDDGSGLYKLEVELEKKRLTSRNFNYYEWPLRRKAEGGEELVKMWAWIIKDMISSL